MKIILWCILNMGVPLTKSPVIYMNFITKKLFCLLFSLRYFRRGWLMIKSLRVINIYWFGQDESPAHTQFHWSHSICSNIWDLAKGFDNVYQSQHLVDLGFKGIVWKLCVNYLSNREQFVEIDKTVCKKWIVCGYDVHPGGTRFV